MAKSPQIGTMEFYIEKQESLAQDRFAKNGVSKELHIVAKCIPFTVHVVSTIDLNEAPITAKLIYDFDNDSQEEKEVDTLKSSPMDYVAHVNSMGDKAAVEVRISVLSSQHEGAYFRVRLSTNNPENDQCFEAISHPIKVISKRNQVKKMLERNEISREDNPHIQLPSPSSPPVPTKRSTPSSPNRDLIAETLLRLEEQQREQARLLQELCTQKINSSPNPTFHFGVVPQPDEVDFETAFQTFLTAFQKVPAVDRPAKIRKVLQSQSQSVNDFLDVANVETGRQLPDHLMESLMCLPSGNTSDLSSDFANCPNKREMEQLDDFYSDFFQDPMTPPMQMISS